MPQKEGSVDFLPSNLHSNTFYQQEFADAAEWLPLDVSGQTSVHN